MGKNDLTLALRNATITGNTNEILSLISQVNPQDLENDVELEDAYRMALAEISE